jgi:hypothetical protein
MVRKRRGGGKGMCQDKKEKGGELVYNGDEKEVFKGGGCLHNGGSNA